MQQEEIAEQSGISYSLLQSWEEDKTFKSLIEYNYQEFLIYIVNLFA
jgi:transcriptional regulator with XRE-family HTH domain